MNLEHPLEFVVLTMAAFAVGYMSCTWIAMLRVEKTKPEPVKPQEDDLWAAVAAEAQNACQVITQQGGTILQAAELIQTLNKRLDRASTEPGNA